MQRVSFDRVDFFLGATTPAGFKGYFEPLRREPGMQMYLIKSGPGWRYILRHAAFQVGSIITTTGFSRTVLTGETMS